MTKGLDTIHIGMVSLDIEVEHTEEAGIYEKEVGEYAVMPELVEIEQAPPSCSLHL